MIQKTSSAKKKNDIKPSDNKTDKKTDLPEPLAQQELCPAYCPFLKQEAFYCRLFDIQLMASPPLIYKCFECMNSDTRKSAYKKKVKEFEERVYMWDKALKRTHKFDLKETIRTTLRDWKERKVFKEFLMAMAGSLPIMVDAKLRKLLLNLYLVLDSSEKMMMKSILSNPKAAEILIAKIKSVGKSPDLLKIVRKEMDDIEKRKKIEDQERFLKQKMNQASR